MQTVKLFNGQVKEMNIRSVRRLEFDKIEEQTISAAREFDLVLVLERVGESHIRIQYTLYMMIQLITCLDESMVLLSKTLCWPLKNVTSFVQKETLDETKVRTY